MLTSDADHLRTAPLFRHLSAERKTELMNAVTVTAVPKRTNLFREGGTPDRVHILLSGRVGLTTRDRDRDIVVEFMGPGDAFLVPAVMLDLPYLMSAHAAQPSRIATIAATEFRRLVATEHALAFACVQQLAGHWRVLVTQIKDLKLKSGVERLKDYLIAQAGRDSGAVTLELAGTQKLLAGRLGMTPETMSRAMRQLRDLGVAGRGRRIAIADLARLRGEA
jgi:CRP/FNR family transcriptional activator FtrB